ncbi:alpha-glutamyl/putrescinyl thymine pyrophosphorylase clade 3 protein [Mesorhizobium sp. RSR565B]|uniref:alpha-glutamyl/putrescinyl thymine pyrophosphorylase clade 3 protein n=1 Tax=unclassified Mesorhizobium TaxID=325217 RepID=UPI0003D04C0D|nr:MULTISPECIES: hypothetical protein [unclassified Mesorhizobium]ESZ46530.1 hypothetical protein X730_20095 [Mesorhizobium sp. L103C565B0]ESZ62705.1 hypothetical protein X729_11460 [Mesorhizobium sp. L103C131B0]
MSAAEHLRIATFQQVLHEINNNTVPLPGLATEDQYNCLAKQLVDSRRRIEFVFHIRDGQHHPSRADPASGMFDPLKAAVLHLRAGRRDEAYWLVFLATHFGKHQADGWELTRQIYGKVGGPSRWDWAAISQNPGAFRPWLAVNEQLLRIWRFSNHRKYESLRADSTKGTARVFETYVAWVGPPRTHAGMIHDLHVEVGQNPQAVFDKMYRSMDDVMRFGRLGRFDFLTMLGKLGIAPIEPGSAYLWHSATGPLRGARLLFGGAANANLRASELDDLLLQIDAKLKVGMQALEDSLCNWQKSPAQHLLFRG